MKQENGLGYINLAALRNRILHSMSSSKKYDDQVNWTKNNKELVRVENGIIAGLNLLKEEGRASLYTEICQARLAAQYKIYTMYSQNGFKGEEDLKALTHATEIEEASDYLELLLQLNFPQEFPNAMVQEALLAVGGLDSPFGSPETGLQRADVKDAFTQLASGQEQVGADNGDDAELLDATTSYDEIIQEVDGARLADEVITIHHSGDSKLIALSESYQPSILEKYLQAKEAQHISEQQSAGDLPTLEEDNCQ